MTIMILVLGLLAAMGPLCFFREPGLLNVGVSAPYMNREHSLKDALFDVDRHHHALHSDPAC
jgi:hypothetical protein